MACSDSFLFSHGEKRWDLDPDKPGCTTSCQGSETNPYFLRGFFSGFLSPILNSGN